MTPEETKQYRLEQLRAVRHRVASSVVPKEALKPVADPLFAGDEPNSYCESYGHTWSKPTETSRATKVHFPSCIYCAVPGRRVELS